MFCCSPSSTEATGGLGHMWSPGCCVHSLALSTLLQCSSLTLGWGFWWESCRGWCRLSAAPSWMFLYPSRVRCPWFWSLFAVTTSDSNIKSDDNNPVLQPLVWTRCGSVNLLFSRLSDSNHPLAQERNQASACCLVLRHREPFGLFWHWG